MSEQYVGAKGNYIESSASAMFVFSWLRGIRLGFLDSADYLEAAQKGYNLLTDKFVVGNADGTANWEGTVSVGSLGSNGTYEVSLIVISLPSIYKLMSDTVLYQCSFGYQRPQGRRAIYAGFLRMGDLGLNHLGLDTNVIKA